MYVEDVIESVQKRYVYEAMDHSCNELVKVVPTMYGSYQKIT